MGKRRYTSASWESKDTGKTLRRYASRNLFGKAAKEKMRKSTMNNIADDLNNAYSDGLRDGAPKWISVKERLPDMCGYKCLVAAVNVFCQAVVFTAFTGYMERGKLEFHSCETPFDLAVWHITHWMPLPKLPEVEG
jgi:hypothetical protein